MLRLMGPCTSRDLATYCRTYVPGVTPDMLERLLSRMHQAQVIVHLRAPHVAGVRFWGLPGQQVRTEQRRVRHQAVIPDRRSGQDQRVSKGSWWATAPRQSWQGTVEKRWES